MPAHGPRASLLGVKAKLIGGYKGSNKTLLAMQQGEIDGVAFGWSTFDIGVPQWFEKGQEYAVPILQVGLVPDPDVPQVPMMSSLVKEEDRPIVSFLATLGVIGRGLALPPNASAANTEVLRAAFDKMMADPAYRADAKKQKLRVNPTSGADLQKAVVDAIDNSSDAVIAKARKIVFGK